MELLSNAAISEPIRLQSAHYFGRFKEAVSPELGGQLINQLN